MAEKSSLVRTDTPASGDKVMSFVPDAHLALLFCSARVRAERACKCWQHATRMGDAVAAEHARRLMLRHQAIAWHLARKLAHEPA